MPRHPIDKAFVKIVHAPGIDRAQMERYNRVKYANVPPSIEKILEVQKATGLSQWDFELKYGLSVNTIAQVKIEAREMPKAYWHIFYDFDNIDKILKQAKKATKQHISNLKSAAYGKEKFVEKKKNSELIIPDSNKKILDEYRRRTGK